MKAVVKLLLVYFLGTPLLRALSVLGLAAAVIGAGALAYLPPLVAQVGLPSRFSVFEEALLQLLPVVGVGSLLFGGSLMSSVVPRLATGRYAYVLPNARGKLLASALATVLLVALVASGVSLTYSGIGLSPGAMFLRTFVVSVFTYTQLYIVLAIVTRARGAFAIIVGSLLVVLTLVMPLRVIGPGLHVGTGAALDAALWAAIAAALLLAPRAKHAIATLRGAFARRAAVALDSGYTGGDELEILTGTAHPWRLALGQAVPVIVAAYLVGWLYGEVAVDLKAKVWLFYLTILSVLSGAPASFAAARTRSLWLRTNSTRAELFARIEAAFWKRNSYALGILLVTMVAVGSYFDMPTRALAFSLALLVLGTTVSTYLGLMTTRTIGWALALVAIGSMLALLAASIYATNPNVSASKVVAAEVGLAMLAVALRAFGARRWVELDWMLCRR
jgi:hypothetical protein